MGLDMYLEGRKFLPTNWNRTEEGFRVKEVTVELGYWRKHPNLHGYIVETFAEGRDECQDIELSAENIEQIIAAVKAKELPHTTGFFFGASEGTQEEIDEDVAIFEKALAWLRSFERSEDQKPPAEEVWPSVVYRASW